jgi:hypothetical protein
MRRRTFAGIMAQLEPIEEAIEAKLYKEIVWRDLGAGFWWKRS